VFPLQINVLLLNMEGGLRRPALRQQRFVRGVLAAPFPVRSGATETATDRMWTGRIFPGDQGMISWRAVTSSGCRRNCTGGSSMWRRATSAPPARRIRRAYAPYSPLNRSISAWNASWRPWPTRSSSTRSNATDSAACVSAVRRASAIGYNTLSSLSMCASSS
jgi:hypothetical protein